MATVSIYSPVFPSVSKDKIFSAMQVLGASLLIALCAQICIPLYFTPVVLSAQTFAVMAVGALLGSRKGALAVMAYLLEGAMGLPFFAGGRCGLMAFVGPTGGYLLAFVFQAYLVGLFLEKKETFHSLKVCSALLLSCMIQLALGTLWLTAYLGMQAAFIAGFCPFVVGEVIKSVALTGYLKKCKVQPLCQ